MQWVDGTPFMINDPSWGPWKWGEPNDYGWASVRLLAGNFLFADRHPWLNTGHCVRRVWVSSKG